MWLTKESLVIGLKAETSWLDSYRNCVSQEKEIRLDYLLDHWRGKCF